MYASSPRTCHLLKATTGLIMMSCSLLMCCRCNFLLNNLLDKVLFLTRRREKCLVVAAVRFVRTVISRNVSVIYFMFFPL